jgi:16S rRNA processing protein RimM
VGRSPRPGGSHDGRERPTHLVIGRILGPHGVKGEVQVEILTDFPERFDLLKRVRLGEELHAVAVEGCRRRAGKALLKLEGYDSRETAGKLCGQLVQVPIDEAVPLGDDEYYLYEIEGLEARTAEGEYLGHIVEIIETGSNDVYVVRNGGREILIPALSDVVTKVDLKAGRIEVQLPKGLR